MMMILKIKNINTSFGKSGNLRELGETNSKEERYKNKRLKFREEER